jgi:hypothetical protein
MTRFGRPGRWKDIFGAATIVLALLLLLRIEAAPASEALDAVDADAAAFEGTGTEGTQSDPAVGAVRI